MESLRRLASEARPHSPSAGVESCSCYWSDAKSLVVKFNSATSMRGGSSLILEGGYVKAQCTSTSAACALWKSTSTTSTYVTSSAIVPSAVLSNYPTVISICAETLSIDASGSQGSGQSR